MLLRMMMQGKGSVKNLLIRKKRSKLLMLMCVRTSYVLSTYFVRTTGYIMSCHVTFSCICGASPREGAVLLFFFLFFFTRRLQQKSKQRGAEKKNDKET